MKFHEKLAKSGKVGHVFDKSCTVSLNVYAHNAQFYYYITLHYQYNKRKIAYFLKCIFVEYGTTTNYMCKKYVDQLTVHYPAYYIALAAHIKNKQVGMKYWFEFNYLIILPVHYLNTSAKKNKYFTAT